MMGLYGRNPSFEGLPLLVDLGIATAASSTTFDVPPRDQYLIYLYQSGIASSDVFALQFNSDTGNNYWSRSITYNAGGVTGSNNQFVSTNMARLAPSSDSGGRSYWISLSNQSSTSKVGTVLVQHFRTGTAGSAGQVHIGHGFEWVNTSNQITSITLRTAGANNISVGSGVCVYGRNL